MASITWRSIFSAYEIERRPRGASRHKAAPTFVSGQLFLCQVGCSFGAWLEIDGVQWRTVRYRMEQTKRTEVKPQE
ncbi:hypothetical protein [Pseudomonas sp. SID14000]|uniref:hypothetical protein n=1 Tax=Pseudomonas sp. SID14000 TaxID=1986221 RepID=UPI00111DB2C7|nr:hypothetical protein [Pseudomonas sp. SID14000]